ncbi:hypothetical protein [Hymenobacter nivis]|uniref:hypothetical protein n=1 Tax=Hymenobacter nivis TaxID=1850093 RepID=UPI0013A5B4FE|nr:hypothetical protein [Hymenobacter nivis]
MSLLPTQLSPSLATGLPLGAPAPARQPRAVQTVTTLPKGPLAALGKTAGACPALAFILAAR